MNRLTIAFSLAVWASAALGLGCSPVVRVEPPREPITINLNIKLDADVRVKIEEQAQKDVAKNPEIF